ncbi:hypothetical protein [Methanobrevibacter sp.]|uniref:hypothetical protein n=1 Tax=Methanobrevibacter sp. TaxID=66852 RepID=UPI00388DE1E9
MITKTIPKERYGKLSMSDWMLNENKELRKISKLNEASLVKKDKQISVMRDELSRKDEVIRKLQNRWSNKNHNLLINFMIN